MKAYRISSVVFASACIILAQDSRRTQVPDLLSPAEDTARPSVRDARDNALKVRVSYSMLTPDSLGTPGGPFKTINFSNQPELPLDEADTVVVAEITRAQPFLTPDNKGIYTEYALNVLETIKNNAPAAITYSGNSQTLLREGGTARLPDGRVVRHNITNDVVPVVGQQYLLFLIYRPQLEAFYYLKMWRIEEGVLKAIYPDDVAREDKGRSKYSGMALPEVIAVLRSRTGVNQ